MNQSEMIKIEGTIEDIVYHNEETNFTVLDMSMGDILITVVGEMVDVQAGEEITAIGNYTVHATYGQQFKAKAVERRLPSSANAICKYLSTGVIKGIGPVVAKRIVERFAEDTFHVMENSPEKLQEIKGISKEKAKDIARQFKQMNSVRICLMYLSQYEIDTHTAIKIWKKWGEKVQETIESDPYLLCCEEIGLDFAEAEKIASALEFQVDDARRIKAGVRYVLAHNTNNGHVCLPYKQLLKISAALLELGSNVIVDVIEDSIQQQELMLYTNRDIEYIYLPRYYLAEQYIANRIRMMQMIPSLNDDKYYAEIEKLEKQSGILYADLQKKAIVEAMNRNIFILTGGPGTGKTTALNAMIDIMEQNGLKVGLAAPTGRAAKRMSELTGKEAKTIHRLLEVDFKDEFGKNQFKRNEKNPLPYDAIIVDEMSMVDILLFESLLRAVRMHCKLILVGDVNQLPAVSAGNILWDLIACGTIKTIQLTEIFRQASKSKIVTNAHAIVNGEMPDLTDRTNDFFFLKNDYSNTMANTIVGLCQSRLPRAYGFSPFSDIQVISPTRIGAVGSIEMNRILQDALNPASELKTQVKIGPYCFREGDKVMQIRNNYDIVWSKDEEQGMGIYNGDIGMIEMIDRPSSSVIINFEGRIVCYPFDLLTDIELAYAITVHKSQGSEFEAVIIPLSSYNSKMHYRNLLYTAITRAKSLLIILGSAVTLKNMIDNNRRTLRYTNLADMLRNEKDENEISAG